MFGSYATVYNWIQLDALHVHHRLSFNGKHVSVIDNLLHDKCWYSLCIYYVLMYYNNQNDWILSETIFNEMKALELNRHIFAWLCICPVTDTTNRIMVCYRAKLSGCMILIECVAGVVSALFIYKNVSIDLVNCLYATFQVAALFGVIYMWVIAFVLRNKIIEIFSELQQIHDTSKNFSD